MGSPPLLAGVAAYGAYGPELTRHMGTVSGGRIPVIGVRAKYDRVYFLLVYTRLDLYIDSPLSYLY